MPWRFFIFQLVLLASSCLCHDGAHLGNRLGEYYRGQSDFLIDLLLFFAPCFFLFLFFLLVVRVCGLLRFLDCVALTLAFG